VPSAGGAAVVSVAGDHSAKVKAVVRLLKSIRADDFRTKTIVFSQWVQVLELVHSACQINGVMSVRLYGE
jgi:SNF2 family DNA or RNA helicase